MVPTPKQQHPEIYCDLNGRVSERGYSLELRGSVNAFEKLGLTLERAVGERFTFYIDDENERGEPDDLICGRRGIQRWRGTLMSGSWL